MSLDTTSPRSRRALLGAALGAAAAAVASALGRPAPVRAGTDGDVVLGATNTSGTTTVVRNTTTGVAAFKGKGTSGDGLEGESSGELKSGVYGHTSSSLSYGVYGAGPASYGYLGGSLHGENPVGVCGHVDSTDAYAVVGEGPGTFGHLGALDRGAAGYSEHAYGVEGMSYDGVGGQFSTVDPTGTALAVDGRATFSRSGRITVAAGKSYADVTVAGGLVGTPLCFATVMSYRPGIYVRMVRPKYPTAGKLRIYLNKAPTAATYVAYFVIN